MGQTFSLPSAYKDLLKEVFSFSDKKKVRLYLVGGILRDALLGRKKEDLDFDFCLKSGAINFGRSLAKSMHAGFVILDQEHGACRVVKKIEGKICTFDFTDFRGPTLEEDLLHRDFSINSLALNLKGLFVKKDLSGELIDPYSGVADIKKGLIRTVNKSNFDEDPLRILRAFSFSCILGFKIEAKTLKLIKPRIKKLSDVSFERIRDELFKILDAKNSFDCLEQLSRAGILNVILPEIKMMQKCGQGPHHSFDVWQHSLEAVKEFDNLAIELRKKLDIQNYLDQYVASNRKRFALIKLGIILHDIGKPKAMKRKGDKLTFYGHEAVGRKITQEISKRLKLSNEELDSLCRLVYFHMRPGHLAGVSRVSLRAKFRYFRDTGVDSLAILLLSLADQRATKGPLTTKESHQRHERVVSSLIKEYFHKVEQVKPTRLLTGDDLIKEFKLNPSPLIGKILEQIEELQGIGKLKTKSQALKKAGQLIKGK